MLCAVVGCGLAGLSTAHALVKRGCDVHLYDKVGVGAGASGIASGLLHPYPGKKGVRSKFADEAMEKTLSLIDLAESALGRKVALRNGILRKNWIPEEIYPDLKKVGNDILITSGCTIFMKSYLEGLFQALDKAKFIKGELVDDAPYDRVVYAIGKGFRDWNIEEVQYVKGQILTCKENEPFKRTIIGSGHISPLEKKGFIHVGSTYEHHALNDLPDLEVAREYLASRIETFYPSFKKIKIVECSAEIRVCVKQTYLPLVKKMNNRIWVFTGLGSRGLLYHGLFGEKVAEEVCYEGERWS